MNSEKRFNFVVNSSYVNNDIENILKNVSNIEQIKNYVKENLNNSKMLLNDIEQFSDINEYMKENGYDYFSNIIEKENEYDISFSNIDYHENSFFKHSPILLKSIPKKRFFIDFLDNIENLINKLVEYLKNTITFKKHLILLNEIEQFLDLDFNENICLGYDYNNKYYNNFPKFFNMDIENMENTPKNIYKILKHSYLKILNCIYKIIEQNVL